MQSITKEWLLQNGFTCDHVGAFELPNELLRFTGDCYEKGELILFEATFVNKPVYVMVVGEQESKLMFETVDQIELICKQQ